MAQGWLGRVESAVTNKHVTPPEPSGHRAYAPHQEEPLLPADDAQDQSASWSTFITYTDSKGDDSARVITFRKISGRFGHPETIHAYCHLRKEPRRFTISNITGMVCTATGEDLDPLQNCLALHRAGALKIEDLVLTRVMRLLTFMARCDGEFHTLEQSVLSDVIGRYFRFFGGDDDAYECAIREAPRLAPSGDQFLRDLRWLKTAPQRSELSRFVLDGCAQMIEADGVQAPEEVTWALEVSDALKRMAAGS